jgi:WD40 repeat protein
MLIQFHLFSVRRKICELASVFDAEWEFQSNVARFTLPIRSLAFNKKGTLVAAAGDDDGIKLIATIDNTISKVLKGHKGSVTGLSFDPKNDYLASRQLRHRHLLGPLHWR